MNPPTIKLEKYGLLNVTTTANEPAIIIIAQINNGTPFLTVSSSATSIDVKLEPQITRELIEALTKTLERIQS
jgi:hypothetical protein